MQPDQGDLFKKGPNTPFLSKTGNRAMEFTIFAQAEIEGKSDAEKAVDFLQTLKIPEGPSAGTPINLAPFQRQFVEGALADGIAAAILSIGRGNAKTALSAGIALGGLVGAWDRQPRREILFAARTRDQA